MKQIFTGIEINAPVEKVWEVLTNFEEYPKWNPFIKLIDGEVKEGSIFKVIPIVYLNALKVLLNIYNG